MSSTLQTYLAEQKNGVSTGIYSVCSAHPLVLRAAAELAAANGSLLLVEATSNQVNQSGGYTGMQPADFRIFVEKIAAEAGFTRERLILGGDHLGPNPWRQLPADVAMQHARVLVSAYVQAGFSKIHLDASMSCEGDPPTLSDTEVAARSVQLCLAAEAAHQHTGDKPVYVIGTEVPTPGGATHRLDGLAVTPPEAAAHTLAVHHKAFMMHGLTDAWTRVIALVVQPGVEFDHDSVVDYDRSRAEGLIEWRRQEASDIVFEAHSTDYQNADAYRHLVEDGFSILKVGPALTFALREALYSLAEIEAQVIEAAQQSHFAETIERIMLVHPEAWQPYYAGNLERKVLLRRYSYSDRVRYYWHQPEVAAAVNRLIANLSAVAIPESMLSLYLPTQYARMREGTISRDPTSLIVDKIKDVLRVYDRACN